MADYRFVTEWRLQAPIDRVYELIEDAQAWPGWWPPRGVAGTLT